MRPETVWCFNNYNSYCNALAINDELKLLKTIYPNQIYQYFMNGRAYFTHDATAINRMLYRR